MISIIDKLDIEDTLDKCRNDRFDGGLNQTKISVKIIEKLNEIIDVINNREKKHE